MRRLCAVLLLAATSLWTVVAQELALPNRADSVKFAVIGDSGTGERPQYEVAERMTEFHGKFPFEAVIMLGDNLYSRREPKDFVMKFEEPLSDRSRADAGQDWRAVDGRGHVDRDDSRVAPRRRSFRRTEPEMSRTF